jgi:uncharacterized membrane protein
VYSTGIAVLKGPAALRNELGAATVVAGLAINGGYVLVLTAYERAPAAPVAAVRETSVVIATALAAVFLKERGTVERFVGAAVVVAGIALLS